MKALSQHTITLILSAYVGLLLNLVTYYRNAGDSLPDYIAIGASAAAITALVYFLLNIFALFGKFIYRLLASLMVLFSGAASYYMIFFNVVIGYGVIVSVLTTDTDLSKESLGYKFIGWFLMSAVLPVVWIWRTKISNDVYNPFSLKSVAKPVIACIVSLIAVHNLLDYVDTVKREIAAESNTFSPSPSGRLAHTYLPLNWITATALFAWEKGYGEKSIEKLYNPAKHFSYNASTPLEDTYVVVVIGETTRADHMGMLGYERDTTPLMSKEKNLVAFRGVSCDTATKLSLRCMFVRENGTEENEQRTLKEYNIFAVLKHLGFTSELFAMQSEIWFYNSLLTDSYKFREIIAAEYPDTEQAIDDMLLVKELKKSVANHPKGKHLIILHTKGSHYLYSERYPHAFAKFTPECRSIDGDCSADQMINAFDNSVLYIDTIMKNIFDILRDKKAVVYFASDHGESISENEHFHATPRKVAPPEQFRVPMIFWASDAFLNSSPAHAAAFNQLKALKNSDAIISHKVLFDSILGCLGYESPDGGIDSHNDVCSASYTAKAIIYPIGGAYPAEKPMKYIATTSK